MAINFNNVSLLSISQEPIKLDSDFKFAIQKNIKIAGNLLDLTNDSGVENIFEETNNLVEVNIDSLGSINEPLDDILINDISYGEGYVENFNVSGDQIQTAQYEADIIITEAGNLSEIILTQNELTPTSTASSAQVNLDQSSLEDEDLKYLSDFSENFSFDVDENNFISINHDISCSFEYRKSLISSKKDIWTGASIQQSKLVNLKNKGKKSIKVSAGTTASYSLTLNPKSSGAAQEYTLFFDYLGQNANTWGTADVDFGGNSITLGTIAGRKKIKLDVSATTSVTIILTANSSQDTFFDNFKLFKTDELPIEKSRALANFLLSNSPNYPIIQSQHTGEFKNLNLFENFSKNEKFDEVNLQYSISKSISHNPLDASSGYSLFQVSSLVLSSEGFIQINEESSISALLDKSESGLRNKVDEVENGGYARSLNYISNYNSYFPENCATPTTTATANLFLNPISNSKNFNFFEGKATLELSFTDDPSYIKDTSNNIYRHQKTENINYIDGYFDVSLVGQISGDGNNKDERNLNAENGLSEILLNADSRLLDIKQRYSLSENFNIVEKSINKDPPLGNINYSLKYSNQRSYQVYPSTGTPLIKKYEIDVSIDDPIRIYNEFNINCKVVPQFLGNLKTAKGINVNIDVEGYKGVSAHNLLSLSKNILKDKGLFYGQGSDDIIPPTNIDQFISEEGFQHSEAKNSFSYSRSILDLSQCPGETPTETIYDLWGDWEVTPTPFTVEYTIATPTESIIYHSGQEPITVVYTPYEYIPPPTDTETLTQTETQSQTETFTPATETRTTTTTETLTLAYYSHEVFIPKNYTGTIANLVPQGIIKSGRTCFDGGDSTIQYGGPFTASTVDSFFEIPLSISYANSTVPKDCEYSNSSFGGDQRFYSFIFDIPEGVPPPADARLNPYPYYAIDIPDFWTGSINNLIPDNNPNTYFIGGYRTTSIFEYGNPDAQNPADLASKRVLKRSEYNNKNPYYNMQVADVYSGPLIFKSIVPLTPTPGYNIYEFEIPRSSNDPLGSFYTPTTTEEFSIVGVKECNGLKSFNDQIPITPTSELPLFYVAENSNITFTEYLNKRLGRNDWFIVGVQWCPGASGDGFKDYIGVTAGSSKWAETIGLAPNLYDWLNRYFREVRYNQTNVEIKLGSCTYLGGGSSWQAFRVTFESPPATAGWSPQTFDVPVDQYRIGQQSDLGNFTVQSQPPSQDTEVNYKSEEVIDECTELSTNRKLNSFYIKQEL